MSLEIVFITSSKIKLAHAQYLCRDYNMKIVSYRKKHYGIGYEEPRIYNRDELLQKSYYDALDRWNNYTLNNENKMFIIEDTSVKINALSDENNEVPGLDIKYWMQENDFESVDNLLKSKGNVRTCTVRSDVILHLSKDLQKKLGKEYLHFTSEVYGSIVDTEFEFKTNPLYPWLDNKTFNKWFVPIGETKPISQLNIVTANKHDFRAGVFSKITDFLESVNKIPILDKVHNQRKFAFEPLYILCGPTCAGKSTLATYLADNYGYFHIEASDFMWLKYHEKHGTKSDVKIGDFATEVLLEKPSIITDQIIEFIKKRCLNKIVISGFRSEKEIEFIKNWDYDFVDIQEIYIDANIDIRFEREVTRNRKDIEPTKEKFVQKDSQQFAMGLDKIKEDINNELINESTYKNFYNEFCKKNILNVAFKQKKLKIEKSKKIKLENAILCALYNHKENSFTTTEISKIINDEIVGENYSKHKDNVSRYFNQNFYPYYDIEYDKERDVIKYKINFTGISQVKLMLVNL